MEKQIFNDWEQWLDISGKALEDAFAWQLSECEGVFFDICEIFNIPSTELLTEFFAEQGLSTLNHDYKSHHVGIQIPGDNKFDYYEVVSDQRVKDLLSSLTVYVEDVNVQTSELGHDAKNYIRNHSYRKIYQDRELVFDGEYHDK